MDFHLAVHLQTLAPSKIAAARGRGLEPLFLLICTYLYVVNLLIQCVLRARDTMNEAISIITSLKAAYSCLPKLPGRQSEIIGVTRPMPVAADIVAAMFLISVSYLLITVSRMSFTATQAAGAIKNFTFEKGNTKVAAVVGGTTGIGEEVACLLAKIGCSRILVFGRNETRAQNVIERMNSLDPSGQHEFVKGDLS